MSEELDESQEFNLGILDVVFGILTLPLLFWALMYAVSGGEHLVATPRARLRLYAVLLALEALIAIVVVVWLTT